MALGLGSLSGSSEIPYVICFPSISWCTFSTQHSFKDAKRKRIKWAKGQVGGDGVTELVPISLLTLDPSTSSLVHPDDLVGDEQAVVL